MKYGNKDPFYPDSYYLADRLNEFFDYLLTLSPEEAEHEARKNLDNQGYEEWEKVRDDG